LQWNVQPLLASTISLLERQTRACSCSPVEHGLVEELDRLAQQRHTSFFFHFFYMFPLCVCVWEACLQDACVIKGVVPSTLTGRARPGRTTRSPCPAAPCLFFSLFVHVLTICLCLEDLGQPASMIQCERGHRVAASTPPPTHRYIEGSSP